MTAAATSFALVAFAANSVLTRLALGEQSIDAASFTLVRLVSGALVLLFIMKLVGAGSTEKLKKPLTDSGQGRLNNISRGGWTASAMLFLYAATFSFAYISLETATGALILFGAVQLTMIISTVLKGNQLHLAEWLGVSVAFAGFVYLIMPSITTPSVIGFALMTLAGIAWGFYTLLGKGSTDPLADTASNFARTIPMVIALGAIFIADSNLSTKGIILASLSGTIASGFGYTVWYIALRGLSTTLAAVSQLSVPLIAAFGGILFVSETLTLRFLVSAMMILGV